MISDTWWQSFFDADYLRLWSATTTPERTTKEADQIWTLCALHEGSRVLDAPCGSGRISRALAERGAHVLGVDQSAESLAEAERTRGELTTDRLRYSRHDLRERLDETGFDVALNVFTSLGYGTEDEDLAILTTLGAAIRPGGLVIIETNHRDNVVAKLARGTGHARRLSDGSLFSEEPRLDAVRGRVETTFYWAGPTGCGQKSATIRVYCIPELLRLVERAGLVVHSVHDGLSLDLYKAEPPTMGGRVGIVATR